MTHSTTTVTRKIGLISLGCAKNLIDAEIMLGDAKLHGYELTTETDDADVVLVNTCGFIDPAKEESISAILEAHRRRLHGAKAGQKLVVGGCLSQRYSTDLAAQLPEVDAEAIGWYGISMGTAYGLPLVAAHQNIKAAVLGMWGTSRVASERLVIDAADIHCPVLFQQKADDEFFTSEGQTELFDAIASRNKTHRLYPGLHTDPKDEQLRDIEAFLVQHLQHR